MAAGLFGTSLAAPELQQTRIQPQGTPGSTFVRPQQVQVGGNLQALAEALGGFNSALQSYAQVKDQINDDPNSRANKEWVAKRQQMSIDELKAEAAAGSHSGIRVRQDALEGLLGERANADFRQEWTTYYNTDFDRTNGDAAAEYEAMREKYAAGLPSEVARGNFYRLSDGHREAVLSADSEAKLTTAKQQVNATIVDSWHIQIGDAMKAGETDPTKIAAAVIEGSASNEAFYGLSGQEQIDTLWSLAERVALEGNPELAKAILESPRKAADGSALPAISSLGAYTVKAAKLVEASQGVKAEAANTKSFDLRLDVDRKVAMGELTPEAAEALPSDLFSPQQKVALVSQSESNKAAILNKTQTADHKRKLAKYSDDAKATVQSSVLTIMGEHGGVYKLKDVQVPTKDGGVTTYTRDEQVRDATSHMEEQWSTQERLLVEQEGMDPKAAKKEMQGVRLAWYEANNIRNDVWANMLAGLPVEVNADVLAKNPAAAAGFIERAELYRDIKARNPAYAETLLTPQSRTFLDAYTMAVEVNRQTPEDALAWAAGWMGKTDSEKARMTVDKKTQDAIIEDVMDEIGADLTGASYETVRQKFDSMSALGTDEDTIRKQLTGWAKDSTYVINGMAMPAHRNLPQDFPILADMELDRVFQERGEALGIEDAEDLFLQPVSGETKWQVWSKSLGGPVGRVYVTRETLDAQRAKVEEDRKVKQKAMIDAANADQEEARRQFDEYVAFERQQIAAWRKQGKLGQWAADGWEADLEEYIRNSDPEYVKTQQANEDAKFRLEWRTLQVSLGFDDPFPEDGPLPTAETAE